MKWFDVTGEIINSKGYNVMHTTGIKTNSEHKAIMWFKRLHDTVKVIEVRERV